MDLILDRLDAEPRGVEGGKEEQDQHRADRRAADQRVRHRSPKHRVRQWNERKNGSQCGQDNRARPLDVCLDDFVIIVEAGCLIFLDLLSQDQRVAHDDAGQAN